MQTRLDCEWKTRIESVGLNYPITKLNFITTIKDLITKFELKENIKQKVNVMDKINEINIIFTELFINNDLKKFSEDFNFKIFIEYFKVVYKRTLYFIENAPELKSSFVLYNIFNNNRNLFKNLGVELIGEIINNKKRKNYLL